MQNRAIKAMQNSQSESFRHRNAYIQCNKIPNTCFVKHLLLLNCSDPVEIDIHVDVIRILHGLDGYMSTKTLCLRPEKNVRHYVSPPQPQNITQIRISRVRYCYRWFPPECYFCQVQWVILHLFTGNYSSLLHVESRQFPNTILSFHGNHGAV